MEEEQKEPVVKHDDHEEHRAKDTNDSVQNASTCSDWFNTTRDEMILYEKFGEDYDEVVNKMSHDEKLKLKQEVETSVPKDVSELANLHPQKPDDEEPKVMERSISKIEETPNVSFREQVWIVKNN